MIVLLFLLFFSKKFHFFWFHYVKAIRTYSRTYLGNLFSWLIVLDKWCKILRCSIITDCMSKMLGFSIAFGCWIIFLLVLQIPCFLLQIRIIIFLSITRISCYFLLIWFQETTNIFSSSVWFSNNLFIKNKFKSFIIIFKDKGSALIGCHLFYNRIYIVILEEKKAKKIGLIWS